MKKFVLSCLVALSVFGGFQAYSYDSASCPVWEKLAFYLPNRVMDALDMFSVEIGFGPVVRCEMMATEWVKGGVGVGASARAVKSYNRQYGFCLQNGWYWQLVTVGAEEMDRPDTTRWVQNFRESRLGIPNPEDRIYNVYTGARDFWRIGGALGLGVEAEVYLNPIDIADFVTGWFFIDLKGDDITSENFR